MCSLMYFDYISTFVKRKGKRKEREGRREKRKKGKKERRKGRRKKKINREGLKMLFPSFALQRD